MATPEKCLFVFTSKLGCRRKLSDANANSDEVSSVLPCFLENDSSRCSLPSLCLDDHKSVRLPEQESVEEMKATLVVRKQTIALAPTAILKNVCRSFGSMLDHRIKELHLMMAANRSEDDKVNEQNLKISSLLCSRRATGTSFSSAESSFRPMPMSKGFVKHLGRLKAVILPLVFKTTIEIDILGVKSTKLSITAPGTIVGSFVGSCNRLQNVDVDIDIPTILLCMKARCDRVVTEAFKAATLLTIMPQPDDKRARSPQPSPKQQPTHKSRHFELPSVPISP